MNTMDTAPLNDLLDRLPSDIPKQPFKSAAELDAFWRWCDAGQGPNPDPEPDWDEHLKAINASRRKGLPGV